MTIYENKEILRQIYFEWFKNGRAQDIVKEFDKINTEIGNVILSTKGIYTKRIYNNLLKVIDDIIKKYIEKVDYTIDIENVVSLEIKTQRKILKSVLKKDLLLPDVQKTIDIVLFNPITEGATYKTFLDTIDKRIYTIWDANLRTGYITGEPTKSIVGKVIQSGVIEKGAMSAVRRSVETHTRTALHSFSEGARRFIFKKNEDLFSGYKWTAVLDTRTCLVCANHDGKIYSTLEKAPQAPLHFNCRCLLLPIIQGYDDLKFDDERESMDGTIKDITFSKWLENQSKERQEEILGKARYKLYTSGYPIKDFIAGNKILTLNELKEKYKINF